jgi:hypothetical protein
VSVAMSSRSLSCAITRQRFPLRCLNWRSHLAAIVLSPEEVLRLLEAAPGPKSRRRSVSPTGPACGPWRLSR